MSRSHKTFDPVSIPQCSIARYTDVWNRHRESEIHDIHEIGSGTKFFITFELKVIRHEERDTQSFYADCFYIVSSQHNERAAPVADKVVWPRPALNLDSLVRRQELNSQLFLKSQPTLPVCDITYIPWSQFLSGIFILTSLNDTSSPCAREHLRSCCT